MPLSEGLIVEVGHDSRGHVAVELREDRGSEGEKG